MRKKSRGGTKRERNEKGKEIGGMWETHFFISSYSFFKVSRSLSLIFFFFLKKHTKKKYQREREAEKVFNQVSIKEEDQ